MVNIQCKFRNPFTVPVWHFMPLDEELALLMVPFNCFFLRGTMRSHVIQYILYRFWILPSPEQYFLHFSFERWTLLECNKGFNLSLLFFSVLLPIPIQKGTLINCADFSCSTYLSPTFSKLLHSDLMLNFGTKKVLCTKPLKVTTRKSYPKSAVTLHHKTIHTIMVENFNSPNI